MMTQFDEQYRALSEEIWISRIVGFPLSVIGVGG